MHSSSPILVAIFTLTLLSFPAVAQAQEGPPPQGRELDRDTPTQTVLIHPPIKGRLSSSEHTYNPDLRLGDQLGRDFSVIKIGEDGIVRRYEPGSGGQNNEDWYGWRKPVLAPIDGRVTRVERPGTTNTPGIINSEAQPGLIFFERDDGTTVLYVHAREISVEEGQRVDAGEVVATVGNNGNSRDPHIHVGAWKGDTPLQIKQDLYVESNDGADEAE